MISIRLDGQISNEVVHKSKLSEISNLPAWPDGEAIIFDFITAMRSNICFTKDGKMRFQLIWVT